MINKMNRSMVAETPEEKKMEDLLKEARKSQELVDFAEELKAELEDIPFAFYSYRVKKVHSAIRSFRISKYEHLEDMHDLFGVLVVVEDEKDIAEVARRIKMQLTEDYQEYDLLTERDWIEQKEARKESAKDGVELYNKILRDLKRIIANTENLEKVLPPLSDIIISHIPMGDKKIPVEFRIQSKNGFQVIESYYFTVYKNDELDPKMKGPLLFLALQLLNRKVRLDTAEDLTEEEQEELKEQMGELYQYNFNLLCQNRDVILEVWKEYVKISAKYRMQLPVYDFHFFGEIERSEEVLAMIDEELDELFEKHKSFDLRDIDTNTFVEKAIQKLQVEALV